MRINRLFQIIILVTALSLVMGIGLAAENISTCTELQNMSLDGDYELTQNISCEEIDNFNPIGYKDNPFTGSLDGQGYVISDLYINRSNEDFVGLFGYSKGVIENLGLENVNITGNDYVGGLAGLLEGPSMLSSEVIGDVSKSFVKGEITGKNHVGGIVGLSYGGSIVETYSRTEAIAEDNVGGTAGTITPHVTINPSITESYSTGTVTGEEKNIGGLVGNGTSKFVVNSVWDNETSGQETSRGGTGLNTEEMQDIMSYVEREWNIDYITDDRDEGYPVLHWEHSSESPTWYISGYEEHNITLDVNGSGNIIKNGETLGTPHTEEFPRGSKITLTAEPLEGNQFVEWTSTEEGILGTSKNITYTVKHDDEEIYAIFVEEPNVSLSTNKEIYAPGEIVNVTITNEGEETLLLSKKEPAYPNEIYRNEEGTWEDIKFYHPETGEFGLWILVHIDPGETYEYAWNQSEYFSEDGEYTEIQAEPGEYQVEWFDEHINFTIEEMEDYVEVTTDSENYTKGEEVLITIKNNYTETIRVSGQSPATPDKIKDTKGEELTFYDPDSKFMQVPLELEPEEETNFIWDQKQYSSPGEQVESGEYSVTWYGEEETFNILEEELEEYELNITVEGNGTTDPEEGTHTYEEGEEVTIEATADDDFEFLEWTGDYEGTEETINITMDGNKSITANFKEEVTPVIPTAATALTIISVTVIFAAGLIFYIKKKEGY
ncbi:MAG: InlB B-repeat-containing protein [archaeon]